MEETYGISHGGRSAEEEFIRLTGATPAPTASVGDVLLEDFPVEIKRATKPTLNQVRAVKYIPLVAYSVPKQAWYVIPAHVVVALVSRKTRGQHSEIPFESATLNLNALGLYRLSSGAELRMATLAAIEQSSEYPTLKEAMSRTRDRARSIADEALEEVRRLLTQLNIEP